jgi:hypothetical protein
MEIIKDIFHTLIKGLNDPIENEKFTEHILKKKKIK